MAISHDWDITVKPTGRCCRCQKEFTPQQEYFAALTEQAQGFARSDFCAACWDQQCAEGYFSFWKSRIPSPKEKKKLLVDDAVLVDFFRRLADTDEQAKLSFRFILALILMRKRILKYEGSQRDQAGREVWRMKLAKSDQVHRVVNPNLDDRQLQQLRDQLNVILAGDVPGDADEHSQQDQ